MNHVSAIEISLSAAYLFRNATAASLMTANFSRMTLIASGSILSGAYGPSDSTQTIKKKETFGQRPEDDRWNIYTKGTYIENNLEPYSTQQSLRILDVGVLPDSLYPSGRYVHPHWLHAFVDRFWLLQVRNISGTFERNGMVLVLWSWYEVGDDTKPLLKHTKKVQLKILQ